MSGFTNPVIPGFHPDPSVCRVGEEYFLVASSFTYFPGVPIFRSSNLVDWTQIGNVLDRPSQLDLSGTETVSSLGVFAPTLRHHDGRFWMITTTLGTRGLFMFFVTAEDPSGPWTDPVFVPLVGIDPDLAWDDDGNCWVHYSGAGIHRARIDDRTGEVLEGPDPTWSGTGLAHPEAPHLYERDGVWYLLIAEGGTERGHAASIARGPAPIGPWESCPSNPILSHRSTDRAIQNTGHADLVDAPDGSSWMVLLGVRLAGITPQFHVLGRETFLTAVEWLDGWPRVAPVELDMDVRPPGAGSPAAAPLRRYEFDEPVLGPEWLALRRPPASFTSLEPTRGLVIDGTSSSLDDPEASYVGIRQQHLRCRVRTQVVTGADGDAGLTVMMDDTAHYEVAVVGATIVARLRLDTIRATLGEAPRPDGPVVLRIETDDHPGGPDTVRLGFEVGDEFRALAEVDGRYLSTEVQGGFIGRTIGLFASGCVAEFRWFEYENVDRPPPEV